MSTNLVAQHAELARVGVDTITPKYQERMPRRYRKYGFRVIPETQLFHRQEQEGDFPLPTPVNEAQAIATVNFWTGNSKDYYWVKYGLGWKTSYEALSTDQYGVTKRASAKMAQAIENGKESTAAGLFNNCTSTAAAYVGSDGVALISTAHPVNSTTWSNRGVTSSSTDADLSVVTLEQAIQNASYNPLSREGNPAEVMGRYKLCVHPSNLGLATRLVTTMQGRPQSNDNDINWAAGFVSQVIENPWFTDEDAWFLVAEGADCPLVQITHDGALTETKRYEETQEIAFFRTEKWLFHYFDARGVWGTVGG